MQCHINVAEKGGTGRQKDAGPMQYKVSKVNVDLYSASSSIQTSNALERSLVIWDHTVLPATLQR